MSRAECCGLCTQDRDIFHVFGRAEVALSITRAGGAKTGGSRLVRHAHHSTRGSAGSMDKHSHGIGRAPGDAEWRIEPDGRRFIRKVSRCVTAYLKELRLYCLAVTASSLCSIVPISGFAIKFFQTSPVR